LRDGGGGQQLVDGEGLGGAVREAHPNGAREHVHVAHAALAVGGVDAFARLGEEGALLAVEGVFVHEAAHQATADARNALGVEREALVFGVADGDRREV
jgi:hypothetical protein